MKRRLKLGIIGGGPGSWIGHVHRIAARFDDKFEIVAGVFSRNLRVNQKFAQKIGIKKDRCYKDFKELCLKEKRIQATKNKILLHTNETFKEISEDLGGRISDSKSMLSY